MNAVHISGNIGAEPEFKEFDSGRRRVCFAVAMHQYRTNGEQCETIWIPCQGWDSVCDRLFKCQQKSKLSGRKINLTGFLAQSKWTDQATGKEHTKLIVKIQSFELISGARQDSAAAQLSVQSSSPVEAQTAAEIVFDGKPVQPGNRLRSARKDSSY